MSFLILLQIKVLNQPREDTHQRTSTQTHLRVQMSQLKLQLMTHIFMFSLKISTMAEGSTQRIAIFCSYTHNIIMLTVVSKPKLRQNQLTIIEYRQHHHFMVQIYQLHNKLCCLIQSNFGIYSHKQNLEEKKIVVLSTGISQYPRRTIPHSKKRLTKILIPTVSIQIHLELTQQSRCSIKSPMEIGTMVAHFGNLSSMIPKLFLPLKAMLAPNRSIEVTYQPTSRLTLFQLHSQKLMTHIYM